jgi:hypothetical protein
VSDAGAGPSIRRGAKASDAMRPMASSHRGGSIGFRRGRRLFGWLAAVALLTHGWLPIVLQAALAEGHGGDHVEHHDHLTHDPAAAAPDLRRSGDSRECPIFHDPICLCAIFVSFLMPASGPVPGPGVVRSPRRRPRPRPRRWRRITLFEARAPPRLP